tara:strand:- start:667 stop:1347 length:681 start_codon:yes stop_codon:yes gene_type:complete
MQFAEHYEEVCCRVAAACARSTRTPGDVRILPVSKKQVPEAIAAAADCGVEVFGESRVQEALQKIPLCSSRLEWHMIGHLQSNKVRPAVEIFRMIHSVDSLKLLQAINQACDDSGRSMPVLLQVNVSGERSKSGLAPEEVAQVLEAASELQRTEIMGLMTLPPFDEDPETTRPYFAALREMRDALRVSSGYPLEQLSMGMSHDFEVAIEEGATWIRLGTILFGKRK